MTPVLKNHYSNLSQSIAVNLASVRKNREKEEHKVRRSFDELRQLVNARERWLLGQLDQLSESQVVVLKSQQSTLDSQISTCDDNELNKSYMPLYKFSEENMARFESDSSVIKDCLLNFGGIAQRSSSLNLDDTTMFRNESILADADKWLLSSSQDPIDDEKIPIDAEEADIDETFEKCSQNSFSIVDKFSFTSKKSDMDFGLEKWLLDGSKDRVENVTAMLNKVEINPRPLSNTHWKDWVREECLTGCPGAPDAQQENTLAQFVEIENLTSLPCFQSNKNQVNTDFSKWLQQSSTAAIATTSKTCEERKCSVAAFCEANEVCDSFDACISAEPGACRDRFNKWLYNPNKDTKLSSYDFEMRGVDDWAKWLKPASGFGMADVDSKFSFIESYNNWLASRPDIKWLADK